MLSEKPRMKAGNFEVIRRWLLVLAVTLAFFYCMDQVLMSARVLLYSRAGKDGGILPCARVALSSSR
jgi:hypothetical protein